MHFAWHMRVGVDGGGATTGPVLAVAVQTPPRPRHPPQGIRALATGNKLGWGFTDLSAAPCILLTACCKWPGLHGGQQGPAQGLGQL